MPGQLKVGGNVIAEHTGVEGAGTVDVNVSNINASSFNGGQLAGMRNLIINGAMQVAQRGTSSTSSGYLVDRFYSYNFPGSNGVTVTNSQNTSTGLSDFPASFKVTVNTADNGTDTTNNYMIVQQAIESQNIAFLNYGTSDAKTVTLSFWVKSSKTGAYTVQIYTDDGITDGAYFKRYYHQYTINSANTWEKKTVTIAGLTDTGITPANDNGAGLNIMYCLYGSPDRLESTASLDTWYSDAVTANSFRGYTGQVNLADTSGATWEITGVQLEVGSTATAFEHRPINLEQHLCERYYEIVHDAYGEGHRPLTAAWTTADSNCFIPFRTRKRSTTSNVTYTGTMQLFNGGWGNVTSVTLLGSAVHTGLTLNVNRSGALVARNVYFIRNGKITVDAEF